MPNSMRGVPVSARAQPDWVWQEFLRNRRMLMSYIRSLVPTEPEAEDLFQETGVVLMRADGAPTEPGKFPAWCRGVARNVVLHHWRQKRRDRVVLSERWQEVVDRAFTENEEDPGEWQHRHAALAACLEALREDDRELITRRFAGGETAEQIGNRFNRSAEAIRMKLMRLRQALGRCLEKRLAGEAGR